MLEYAESTNAYDDPGEEPTAAEQLVQEAMKIARRNTLDRYLGLSGRVRTGSIPEQPSVIKLMLQHQMRKGKRNEHPMGVDLQLGKLFMVNREEKLSTAIAEERNEYNNTFLDKHDLKHRLTSESPFNGNPNAIVGSIVSFMKSSVKSKNFFVYLLRKWRNSVITIQRAIRRHLSYRHSVINEMLLVWQATQTRTRKKLHSSMQRQLLSLRDEKVKITAKGYAEQYLVPDNLKKPTIEYLYKQKWDDLRRRVRAWMKNFSTRERKLTILRQKLCSSLRNNAVVHSEKIMNSLNKVMWDIRALRLTSPKWVFEASPLPFKELLEASTHVRVSVGASSLRIIRSTSEKDGSEASSGFSPSPPSSNGSPVMSSPVRRKNRSFCEEGQLHGCDNCLYCIANNKTLPVVEREPLSFRRRFNSALPVIIADPATRPKSSRSKSLCTPVVASPSPSPSPLSSDSWKPHPPAFPRNKNSLNEAMVRVQMLADDDSE